jgi:hypothetical protein
MTPVLGMTTAAVLSAWLVSAVGGPGVTPAVFGGMIGPLVSAVVTWLVVRRTHRVHPGGVTQVLVTAFVVKAVFFGVYAVAMIRGLGVDRTVFALSFAGYFIGLHAVEAACFARLFRTPAREAR